MRKEKEKQKVDLEALRMEGSILEAAAAFFFILGLALC